jgi:hypothetical protein
MLLGGHVLVDGEAPELEEGGGATDSVGGDDVAIEVANDKAERSALNADVKRRGTEADRGGISALLYRDGLAARSRKDRPGSVLGESATGDNAYAEDVVSEGDDTQTCRTCLYLNAVVEGLGTGYRFDRNREAGDGSRLCLRGD